MKNGVKNIQAAAYNGACMVISVKNLHLWEKHTLYFDQISKFGRVEYILDVHQ